MINLRKICSSSSKMRRGSPWQLNIGTGSYEACIRRSDASGYWSECLSLAAGSAQNAAHANH
jgi:hypothetical protein